MTDPAPSETVVPETLAACAPGVRVWTSKLDNTVDMQVDAELAAGRLALAIARYVSPASVLAGVVFDSAGLRLMFRPANYGETVRYETIF